jgi:hypothetical protein
MFSNSLRAIAVLLIIGTAVALAQVSVIPILITPVSTPIVGALLLEDNASILLLENGTDQFCLEGGC